MKTSFLNIEPKPAQEFYFFGIGNENVVGFASVQLISENLVVRKKNFSCNPSDLIDTNYSRIDMSYSRIDTSYSRIDTSYSRIDTNYSRIDTSYSRIDNFGDDYANSSKLIYNHLAVIK